MIKFILVLLILRGLYYTIHVLVTFYFWKLRIITCIEMFDKLGFKVKISKELVEYKSRWVWNMENNTSVFWDVAELEQLLYLYPFFFYTYSTLHIFAPSLFYSITSPSLCLSFFWYRMDKGCIRIFFSKLKDRIRWHLMSANSLTLNVNRWSLLI